jgi:outer membrane immunogenic protein
MKKVLITSIAAAALSASSAFAADMPLKALPAPYSWTGCYVGVNGGYGWNSGRSGYQDSNAIGDPINSLPAPFSIFGVPTLAYIPTPSRTSGSGGLVGGTGGCNYQSRQWVVGFEADIDWADISGTSNTSANSGAKQFAEGVGTFSGTNTVGTAIEQNSLRWLSTIRARGGVLVSDRLLVFATGGLALGGIKSQGSVNTFSGPFGSLGIDWSGSSTSVRVGGVVGGGLEWALWNRTTVKAEYLWYTFGNVSHPLNCSYDVGPSCFPDTFPTLGSTSSSVFGSIVRVGLNYKFGP